MPNGWGGKRFGAGRKPKSASVLQHPSVPPPNQEPIQEPVEEFDAPDTLEMEARHVWLRQAPHAFKNGSLARSTSLSFERYCKLVVAEVNEGKGSGVGGSNHRGLLRQINELERQFGLTATGKGLKKPATPQVNQPAAGKLARFRT